MSDRIPIRYDRALRPEWLDFALEQSVRLSEEAQQRQALRDYLKPQIKGVEALNKTITQLQRIVGSQSLVPREEICNCHDRMGVLAPDQRTPIRLSLLMQSSPFFADSVKAIRKLDLVATDGFTTAQIVEQLTSKYGDRAVVPRAGQRVIQTLALLGALEKQNRRWATTDLI